MYNRRLKDWVVVIIIDMTTVATPKGHGTQEKAVSADGRCKTKEGVV